MQQKHMIAVGAAIAVLVVMTAGASALVTKNIATSQPDVVAPQQVVSAPVHTHETRHDNIHWNQNQQQQVAAQPVAAQQPACDDHNVVGYIVGAAAGGLAGNQLGKGKGNTAATVGGALGGAYLGGQYLPTKNVVCR